MKEKKDKQLDKNLAGFIANTQNVALETVKQTLSSVIPPQPKVLAKEGAAKVEPKPAQGSEKVPEHAKLVLDNEFLAKEIQDLKMKLKAVYQQNVQLEAHVRNVEG
jgi:hypothetical protein